ncbi:hypothetical protein QR685DRAFT_570926 [Neurospora intermedia]|uniref:Uncharacterized protein n=1 Tax=Neurospora intermedia TaxID=5142 RepID=A0ABR3DIB1_NEUIN
MHLWLENSSDRPILPKWYFLFVQHAMYRGLRGIRPGWDPAEHRCDPLHWNPASLARRGRCRVIPGPLSQAPMVVKTNPVVHQPGHCSSVRCQHVNKREEGEVTTQSAPFTPSLLSYTPARQERHFLLIASVPSPGKTEPGLRPPVTQMTHGGPEVVCIEPGLGEFHLNPSSRGGLLDDPNS